MAKFKIGDLIRITKPNPIRDILPKWVSPGMDYLDGNIREIYELSSGEYPIVHDTYEKNIINKWVLDPAWCTPVVVKERPLQKGDWVKVIEPKVKDEEYPIWNPEVGSLLGERAYEVDCIWYRPRVGNIIRIIKEIEGRRCFMDLRPEWCELVEDTEGCDDPCGDSGEEGSDGITHKMKIYIVGKITGLEYGYAKALFDEAKANIEKWGFEAVSPFDYEFDNCSWTTIMLALLPTLNECEGIYLLDNWDDSDGARIEKKFAEKKGMFVIKEVI